MKGSVVPSVLPKEEAERLKRRERSHVAALIKRAEWLSKRIQARRLGFDVAEFDAIVWALTKIVGEPVVNRWLGLIDRTPHPVGADAGYGPNDLETPEEGP